MVERWRAPAHRRERTSLERPSRAEPDGSCPQRHIICNETNGIRKSYHPLRMTEHRELLRSIPGQSGSGDGEFEGKD